VDLNHPFSNGTATAELIRGEGLDRYPHAAGSRVGAIVSSEDYHLYRLRRERLGGTAQAAQCAADWVH